MKNLLLLLLAACTFAACNNFSKALRKGPLTSKDTGALALKCHQLFPVKEGVIRDTSWVESTPDTGAISYFQNLLAQIKEEAEKKENYPRGAGPGGITIDTFMLRNAIDSLQNKQTVWRVKTVSVKDTAEIVYWRNLFNNERVTTINASAQLTACKEQKIEGAIETKKLRRTLFMVELGSALGFGAVLFLYLYFKRK